MHPELQKRFRSKHKVIDRDKFMCYNKHMNS